MTYPAILTNWFGQDREYFFGQPGADEIGEDGFLSQATLQHMDGRICTLIQQHMQGWEPQGPLGKGTDPNNRWRAVSSMQKAIRFGMVEHAGFVASAAYDMDAAYVMRRLGVIGIEDVGFGNLFAVVAAQAAAHSVVWRRKVGERRLYIWMAELMAKSTKDRTATELLVLADLDKELDKEAAAACSDAELREVMFDPAAPLQHRMICSWLLAGTKRFKGENMPETNDRHWQPYFRALVEKGLPRVLLYAAHRSAFRVGDHLFSGLFLMDEWIRDGGVLTTVKPEMPLIEKVGVLLGPAYDMHTREGRIAFRRWEKECPAVGAFRDKLDPDATEEQRKHLLGFGMFLAEGGVLHERLVYGSSEGARAIAHDRELFFPGVPRELHAGFLATLRGNLAQLNDIRRSIVQAKFGGAA